VVIVIVGILSAIALPSFLSQTSRAKEAEATANVGAVNRAQEAYFFERRGVFAPNLTNLQLGFDATTTHYQYTVQSASKDSAYIDADPIQSASVRNLYGAVVKLADDSTRRIICKENDPGTAASVPLVTTGATSANTALGCPIATSFELE